MTYEQLMLLEEPRRVPATIPTQSPEEDWSDHMQNHQADSPLYVRPDVRSADLHLLIKSMVIHDTECPSWDQVSLNNTNQTCFIKYLSALCTFIYALFPQDPKRVQSNLC